MIHTDVSRAGEESWSGETGYSHGVKAPPHHSSQMENKLPYTRQPSIQLPKLQGRLPSAVENKMHTACQNALRGIPARTAGPAGITKPHKNPAGELMLLITGCSSKLLRLGLPW